MRRCSYIVKLGGLGRAQDIMVPLDNAVMLDSSEFIFEVVVRNICLVVRHEAARRVERRCKDIEWLRSADVKFLASLPLGFR